MNPQQQYQRPIDEADRNAYRQHCRNHWSGDVGIPVDYPGKQRGRQRDIGIEREIDASSQNDHCLPERYKCEAGCLLEYVDGIVEGTEAVADRETNDKEQSDYADFDDDGWPEPPRKPAQPRQRPSRFSFGAVDHFGNAKAMIASSVMAAPASSPAMDPSHITKVRSHIPTISSNSELIIKIANPASANCRMIR